MISKILHNWCFCKDNLRNWSERRENAKLPLSNAWTFTGRRSSPMIFLIATTVILHLPFHTSPKAPFPIPRSMWILRLHALTVVYSFQILVLRIWLCMICLWQEDDKTMFQRRWNILLDSIRCYFHLRMKQRHQKNYHHTMIQKRKNWTSFQQNQRI